MRAVLIIARILVGVAGIGVLVLGLLFWTGNALSLIPIHQHLGETLLLGLMILAVLGIITRASWPLSVLVILWCGLVPYLGKAQLSLMPGSNHWVIQLAHLLVGVTALGLGHMLAARINRALSAAPARPLAAGQS